MVFWFVLLHLKCFLHLSQIFLMYISHIAMHPWFPLILKTKWQVRQLAPPQPSLCAWTIPHVPRSGISFESLHRAQKSTGGVRITLLFCTSKVCTTSSVAIFSMFPSSWGIVSLWVFPTWIFIPFSALKVCSIDNYKGNFTSLNKCSLADITSGITSNITSAAGSKPQDFCSFVLVFPFCGQTFHVINFIHASYPFFNLKKVRLGEWRGY